MSACVLFKGKGLLVQAACKENLVLSSAMKLGRLIGSPQEKLDNIFWYECLESNVSEDSNRSMCCLAQSLKSTDQDS